MALHINTGSLHGLHSNSGDNDKLVAKAIKTAPETRSDRKKAEEPKSSATTSRKHNGDDDSNEFRVIIKGLPFIETQGGARKAFSSSGKQKIKDVKMLRRKDGSFNGVCSVVNYGRLD